MQVSDLPLIVSVCIPAYNEGKNIRQILQALLQQRTNRVHISQIVVVSSGSTDDTNDVVRSYAAKHSKVRLICQNSRSGKASAINAFLAIADEKVVVVESADTVPNPDAIEKLCEPFIDTTEIGLTGGAPIPVNDPDTFTGYIVHTWWWFHRHIPRFGEIIAFRNIIPQVSETTAVDEAFIQAKIIQSGYRAVHVDEAVVRNKGPETVADLIKQRRRIFNGHSRLYQEEKVKIDNMTKSSFKLLLEYPVPSVKHRLWFVGGIILEMYARLLGTYDSRVRGINPFIWDTATTTKNLALEGLEETDEVTS